MMLPLLLEILGKLNFIDASCGSFDLRLLVVDDNEEITEVITFYCGAKKDIDCQVVNNGPQGLQRIRKEKFDLILLDALCLGLADGTYSNHSNKTDL